jgi:putative component of toxin-antitoxin plasmid stabilization module
MPRSPFLHPILLALFPIAFLAVNNLGELGLADIVRSLALAVILALAIVFLARLAFASWLKAGIAASLALVLFFSFGHLAAALRLAEENLGWTFNVYWQAGLLLIIILAGGWILLIRTQRSLRKLTITVNTIATVLLGMQLIQGAFAFATTKPPELHDNFRSERLAVTKSTPDIYFIVLDAFGREDIVRDIYGYDANWFVEHLERKGFFVAERSHSNYCHTSLSLTATLNLDYLETLGAFDPRSHEKGPLTPLLRENRVFGLLREQGYHLTAFSSAFPPTEFDNADTYYRAATDLNEFEMTVLGTTPLPFLLRSVTSSYDLHRQRINNTFAGLEEIELGHSPQFVFAHLMTPHPPFIFNASGGPTEPSRPFYFGRGTHFFEKGGTAEEYVAGYRDQIAYITTRLRQMVDRILSRYGDNPPIIILQGDHGPGSRLYWQNVKKTDIKECFSILNAVYLPDQDYSSLYSHITPVNTFRVLFNQYFDGNFELLPDRSFFSAWTRPYLNFEVTENLRKLSGVESPVVLR